MENQEINYEEKIELLDEILNSSIEFDVKKHRFLWIRQYYGNKKIYLDLSKKDKDMMEQLFIEEEKVYNDDYDIDQGWWCNMKNELLNYKADESNENIYTNMNNFMDYVYQKDLYQYTNDIYDDNAIKEKLKKAIDIVHELLKNTITDFEYKKENNRTYASFTLTKPLEQREQTMLKGRISSNMYHVSIDNGNNSKSIIEVHLKNPLEYDFTLEKGNKNV